jgi:hypothetical protein
VYGPDGNLYVGGQFTTAYNAAGTGSPVTVNNIAKWDGTTWSALDQGVNGIVYSIIFDATGRLFAGGAFTADVAGPTALDHIGQWDGSSWTSLGLGGTGPVLSLATDYGGNIYAGGTFVNWDGLVDADNIVKWNGSAYEAMSTGANGTVETVLFSPYTGDVFIGGSFTLAGGVAGTEGVAYWNGFAWQALGTGLSGGTVEALFFHANSILYAGGSFTDNFAQWTGTEWAVLIAAPNNTVRAFANAADRLLVGGDFTSLGTSVVADSIAQWTGSAWLPFDLDLPGVGTPAWALASQVDGRIAVGFNATGTATGGGADTTVTNTGTSPAWPIFTFTGPGTLESISNYTTGQNIYTNGLTIGEGEVVTLDLTPGAIRMVSNARGNIGGYIAAASDLATWRLLPGANTVLVRVSGTTTADTAVELVWKPAYQSVEGAVR